MKTPRNINNDILKIVKKEVQLSCYRFSNLPIEFTNSSIKLLSINLVSTVTAREAATVVL